MLIIVVFKDYLIRQPSRWNVLPLQESDDIPSQLVGFPILS